MAIHTGGLRQDEKEEETKHFLLKADLQLPGVRMENNEKNSKLRIFVKKLDKMDGTADQKKRDKEARKNEPSF